MTSISSDTTPNNMADLGTADTRSSGRMACAFCRKRKLRCDRQLPKCESCQRFEYECEYGPRKGLARKEQKSSPVRRLEDRLGRLERLLSQTKNRQASEEEKRCPASEPSGTGKDAVVEWDAELSLFIANAVRELEHVYFVYVHPSLSIIHPSRYLLQVNLDEHLQPPDFLRHAMCALAAPASSIYSSLRETLYQSARKLLQDFELNDQSLDKVTLPQAQTWLLISTYEMLHGFIQRSLMSTSRAVRLVQMMRLHRVDAPNLNRDPIPDALGVPKDWTETEERRRLFWATFLMDRYAGISMGWPTLIDSRDIRTFLPVSNEAYENSTELVTMFLSDSKNAQDAYSLSSFAATILSVECCYSRIQELQRLEPLMGPTALHSDIWTRVSQIESLLESTFHIPPHLSVPPGKLDPSTIFANMGSRAANIVVHQVAMIQAGNVLSVECLQRSGAQCMEAANAIAQLMKLTSHWDLHMFHPSTTFCLYAAASVYGGTWITEPDILKEDTLRFLIEALQKFCKITKLSEILLEAIEEELPGLLDQLKGSQTAAIGLYNE
ncbi:fungal-specific transcription factor domain-containing protein [Leptodontidium sp. 2 PMI_412]|nr:fungal-specific transcription factor domain-containing protein [Leptodontidium sp. 2 PMI_412]